MRYDYRCPEGHLSEANHSMAEFGSDWEGPNPRLNPCPCGETAKQVILTTAFFSIDMLSDQTAPNRGRTGGMNAGAGQTFLNRRHRTEWMKQSGSREICPEDSAREFAYLNDCRQAKSDGVAAPEHPDVAKRKQAVNQKAIENLQARRDLAGRDLSAVEDFSREQAAEVLGREQGWTADQGRAYAAGGRASTEAFKPTPPEKVTVPIGSDGRETQ